VEEEEGKVEQRGKGREGWEVGEGEWKVQGAEEGGEHEEGKGRKGWRTGKRKGRLRGWGEMKGECGKGRGIGGKWGRNVDSKGNEDERLRGRWKRKSMFGGEEKRGRLRGGGRGR
jgi:hypothetical protein